MRRPALPLQRNPSPKRKTPPDESGVASVALCRLLDAACAAGEHKDRQRRAAHAPLSRHTRERRRVTALAQVTDRARATDRTGEKKPLTLGERERKSRRVTTSHALAHGDQRSRPSLGVRRRRINQTNPNRGVNLPVARSFTTRPGPLTIAFNILSRLFLTFRASSRGDDRRK